MPLIAATFLVGCGGTDTQTAPTPQPPTATQAPPVATSGTSAADSSAMVRPDPTPNADAGMQLPDVPLPDNLAPDNPAPDDSTPGDNATPSGPTPPGKGGLELPDLELPPQSAAVTPTLDSSQSQINTPVTSGELIFASWSDIESHAKSTGKITVVDLWSTSCAPCLKEFPGLVQLDKTMTGKVACIGVSVDFDGRKSRPPESYTGTVSAFLKAVQADFDNYVCNTPSDDVFAAVDLPSIPAVLVFDATGKLVKKFVDSGETLGFSYETDVTPFVTGLAGS